MTTLHLGVVDLPYSEPPPKKGKRKKKGGGSNLKSTADVAAILEDKYHIMQHFAELHHEDIVHSLENAVEGALENLLSGAQHNPNMFDNAASEIEVMFKDMLTNKELEGIGYPGVPTQAAIKGVSHRFKHPYAKANPQRPSFIDTGLYQSAFKAWIE
jgi:hypothetical protein